MEQAGFMRSLNCAVAIDRLVLVCQSMSNTIWWSGVVYRRKDKLLIASVVWVVFLNHYNLQEKTVTVRQILGNASILSYSFCQPNASPA